MPAAFLLTQNLAKKKWLSYLLDVFAEVTNVTLQLADISDAGSLEGAKFIYAPSAPEHCDIHRRFKFDLLQKAFFTLSCGAEREIEEKNGPIHGYASLGNGRDYLKPDVNYLFEDLRLKILETTDDVPKEIKNNCPVLPTHDIDAVHKTFLKASKQAVMNFYNIPRLLSSGQASRALRLFRASTALPFSRDDFDHIESWLDIDNMAGAKPLFHVYIKVPQKNLRRTLISSLYDPDYDLMGDKALIRRLRALAEKGCQIGLHGSFSSHNDVELLSKEKRLLEQALEQPVTHIRQHWLRFSFKETWKTQEEAGFLYDTGFGFNNIPGFRSRLCHPHHPWNEKKQRAHSIRVIPMAAMDSTLFDYQFLTEEKIVGQLKSIRDEVIRFGGQVCWNWHTHGASRHLKWEAPYRQAMAAS